MSMIFTALLYLHWLNFEKTKIPLMLLFSNLVTFLFFFFSFLSSKFHISSPLLSYARCGKPILLCGHLEFKKKVLLR